MKLKNKVQRDVVDKHGFEVLENLQADTDEAYEKVIEATKKMAANETKDLGNNIAIMLQQDGIQNEMTNSMYEIDETK
jgi:ribosomal protein S17E